MKPYIKSFRPPRLLLVLTLLGPSLGLNACSQTPGVSDGPSQPGDPTLPDPTDPGEVPNFDNDPLVLRGFWVGDEAGHHLALQAQASEASLTGYKVAGSFELDGGETIPFSGIVETSLLFNRRGITPLLTPIEISLTATSPDGKWTLSGEAPAGSPPQFTLFVIGPEGQYRFMMSRNQQPYSFKNSSKFSHEANHEAKDISGKIN